MLRSGSTRTAASGRRASTRWSSASMADAPARRLGLSITRVYDAPRDRVWREWTEPERFADWFGGPEAEVPLDTVAMDVRPGGAWRATMYHGGHEIRWEGEDVEGEPPERLPAPINDQPARPPHQLLGGGRRRPRGRGTERGGGQPGT